MANTGYFPPEDFIGRQTGVADMLVRSVLFSAIFLLLLISFHPFMSLAEEPEVTEAGNFANQLGYSSLLILLGAWCLFHRPDRLLLLVRPILVVTLLWCVLSVVTSWEPSLSARRFALALVTIGIAGMMLLLPKNIRHFGDMIAAVALMVLALCYLGVALTPSLSIHQASDLVDPELAGDWRGVFGHKNEAGAAMVIFTFIGLFITRTRSFLLGASIIALALVFLFFTQSKTSIIVLPLVLIYSAALARIRSPAITVLLTISILGTLNLFSVGSVYFEPVRNLIDWLLSDASFTGRTDIWQFALDNVAQRPITGFGYSAFWGTEHVVYGMGGVTIWANGISSAHNGYLNLALTIGIPGSILFTLWLVVSPLIDYYRSPRDPLTEPLKTLFLRICLFAAYESCFESMFYQGGGLWFVLVVATFGLRFLSVSPVTR